MMDEFEVFLHLPQPELGKFGEFLAKIYWSEVGLDVVSWHRNEIDFYVDKIPYDVKATVVPLKKNRTMITDRQYFVGNTKTTFTY